MSEVQFYDGQVLFAADGQVAMDPACCCGGCSCDGYTTLAIVDYEDGDLAACEACDARTDEPWNGTFTRTMGEPNCVYVGGGYSIDGKDKYDIMLYRTGLTPCTWRMVISCLSTAGATTPLVIWDGQHVGPTPVGTYTRTDGCDLTETLEVG